jgi:hypothetical protein
MGWCHPIFHLADDLELRSEEVSIDAQEHTPCFKHLIVPPPIATEA